MRARLATLMVAVAGVSLGGCAYGGGLGGVSVGTSYGTPYGYAGYGSPYGSYSQYGSPYGYGTPYGYGSYGSPYGYGGYGYDPFGSYNPYYRSPYYGWNDGFYYPGTGYYVYDRDRNRRRLSEAERRTWLQRLAEAAAASGRDGQTTSTQSTSTNQATSRNRATSTTQSAARPTQPNWSGFNREGAGTRTIRTRSQPTVGSDRFQRVRERSEARQGERRSTRTLRSAIEARRTRPVSADD